MLITLKSFGGRAPRTDPRELAPNLAQVATNTKVWSGVLSPFRDYSTVTTVTRAAPIKAIYRFGGGTNETQYWFAFANEVDIVRGPVAGDVQRRTYYTGDGAPKATDVTLALTGGTSYPVNSYTLGVPKPFSTPAASVVGNPTDPNPDTRDADTRVYVYTYVSAWGEEGKPSDASNAVVINAGQSVSLTGLGGPPSGNFNITAKRIYRSSIGNQSSAYQFVAEIPAANTSYSDTKSGTELAEVLASTNYDEPPTDMLGLVALPTAVLAGFVRNEVCFSEIGLPHAWPVQYRTAVDYDIVGLGVFGSTLVVCTNGAPYLSSGSDPASMTMQRLEIQQACVSRRSILSVGDAVLYASPDGLVAVGSNGVELLTQKIFTREEWQALKPESIHAYLHDGRYFGFYNTGAKSGGFILDPTNGQFFDLDFYPNAGYTDLVTDSFYFVFGNDQVIRKWEGAAGLRPYTWRSKKFITPKPCSFSCGIASADSYPVSFTAYMTLESPAQATALVAKYPGVIAAVSGAQVKYTANITGPGVFRLPSGFLSKDWEFELAGTSTIHEVHIGTSVEELKKV
jgi:hypothetical protein